MTKRRSLAEVKAGKKAVSRRVPIVLDGTLAEKLTEIRVRIVELEQKRDRISQRVNNVLSPQGPSARLVSELDEANEAVDVAKAELQVTAEEAGDEVAWFYIEAISPSAFDALLAEHAPTKDQRRESVKRDGQIPQWNWDTFPDALIAACTSLIVEMDDDGNIVEKEDLTEADVKEMREDDAWNAGEMATLFEACQSVNAEIRSIGRVGNA